MYDVLNECNNYKMKLNSFELIRLREVSQLLLFSKERQDDILWQLYKKLKATLQELSRITGHTGKRILEDFIFIVSCTTQTRPRVIIDSHLNFAQLEQIMKRDRKLVLDHYLSNKMLFYTIQFYDDPHDD